MSADDQDTGGTVTPAMTPTGVGETTARGGGRDNVHPLAARKHGAYSAGQLAPIRERHLEHLRARFPAADVTILGMQATRLAQLEAVGVWLDERGIMRNRRTGTIYPAADYWAKVASAYERQHERLEAQAAANGGGDRAPTLREIEAEYAANGGGEA